jgi:hypothetical protein
MLVSVPGVAIGSSLANCERLLAEGPDSKPPVENRPRITISRETTFITGPLRPDGYPDYVAALNRHCSRGVTPENNAAVPFLKAMGPRQIKPERREAYFQMLGIAPLPEERDYFRSASDQVARQKSGNAPNDSDMNPLYEQQSAIMRRPWSRQEFPVWAEWLDVNERPMALLTEASKRPRRYNPWFYDEKEDGIAVDIVIIQQSREAARAFAARAMLRLHDGKVDEAWADLSACHRLARLVGQGPTYVELLVAITIDAIAHERDCVLIEHANVPAARIVAMRQELASLPSLFNVVDAINIGERVFLLSYLFAAARKTPTERNEFLTRLESLGQLGGKESSTVKPILHTLPDAGIDWDTVFRVGNSWFDRGVKALRLSDAVERRKAIADIGNRFRQLQTSVKDVSSLSDLPPAERRKAASEKLGESLVVTSAMAFFQTHDIVMNRATMSSGLTQLAFALAAHRADHGGYPEELGDLRPKYIPCVPKDAFNNDADLHYARHDDGYLLYSVGPNGRDDGGKSVEDCKKGDEGWDDIVVRAPSART